MSHMFPKSISEVDLLKEIVKSQHVAKTGATEEATKANQEGAAHSVISEMSRRDIFKLYLKIWMVYTKFIRSQCLKGNVVDSSYLGYFWR